MIYGRGLGMTTRATPFSDEEAWQELRYLIQDLHTDGIMDPTDTIREHLELCERISLSYGFGYEMEDSPNVFSIGRGSRKKDGMSRVAIWFEIHFYILFEELDAIAFKTATGFPLKKLPSFA